jgi:preprotein translocase subunit SecF
MEVRAKSGTADIAQMRATLGGLGLGEVQLQQFGGPSDVCCAWPNSPAATGAAGRRGQGSRRAR